MSNTPLVSIIIRTKNEERWIGSCLSAVKQQQYNNYEIILVDNNSNDKTIEKASSHNIELVTIEDFYPGLAINKGIRACKGEVVVCLSGHCIPVNEYWLSNLVKELEDPQVAGVYGRQQPMSFSSSFDKRDLMLVFGLDRKVQEKDSFFHNANSAFRRDVWEKYPFDEQVSNIEDRVWGKKVIQEGYKIIYTPDASVYHYHGINQEMNSERADSVVRILELVEGQLHNGQYSLEGKNIVAIIPVRGPLNSLKEVLLELTANELLESRHINRVIVSTDDENIVKFAKCIGIDVPFTRPDRLSEDYVDIGEVLKYSLDELEQQFGLPDLVISALVTYPFRPKGIIDRMLEQMTEKGLDTIVASRPELRQVWNISNNMREVPEGLNSMPRQFKDSKSMISLMGLGLITHPLFLREGSIFGPRTGIFEVNDPFSAIEVRNDQDKAFISEVIKAWKSYIK